MIHAAACGIAGKQWCGKCRIDIRTEGAVSDAERQTRPPDELRGEGPAAGNRLQRVAGELPWAVPGEVRHQIMAEVVVGVRVVRDKDGVLMLLKLVPG